MMQFGLLAIKFGSEFGFIDALEMVVEKFALVPFYDCHL